MHREQLEIGCDSRVPEKMQVPPPSRSIGSAALRHGLGNSSSSQITPTRSQTRRSQEGESSNSSAPRHDWNKSLGTRAGQSSTSCPQNQTGESSKSEALRNDSAIHLAGLSSKSPTQIETGESSKSGALRNASPRTQAGQSGNPACQPQLPPPSQPEESSANSLQACRNVYKNYYHETPRRVAKHSWLNSVRIKPNYCTILQPRSKNARYKLRLLHTIVPTIPAESVSAPSTDASQPQAPRQATEPDDALKYTYPFDAPRFQLARTIVCAFGAKNEVLTLEPGMDVKLVSLKGDGKCVVCFVVRVEDDGAGVLLTDVVEMVVWRDYLAKEPVWAKKGWEMKLRATRWVQNAVEAGTWPWGRRSLAIFGKKEET